MYFVTAVFLLYTQWGGLSSNAPAFKTSVAEGLKQVICSELPGPTSLTETQGLTIDQVNDIPFALDYIGWYLHCVKHNTGFLGLPDPTALWAGEFARISFIQLKIDIESACSERRSLISNSKEMECYSDNATMQLSGNNATMQLSGNNATMQLIDMWNSSGMWKPSPKPGDGYAMVAILKRPGEPLDVLQESRRS